MGNMPNPADTIKHKIEGSGSQLGSAMQQVDDSENDLKAQIQSTNQSISLKLVELQKDFYNALIGLNNLIKGLNVFIFFNDTKTSRLHLIDLDSHKTDSAQQLANLYSTKLKQIQTKLSDDIGLTPNVMNLHGDDLKNEINQINAIKEHIIKSEDAFSIVVIVQAFASFAIMVIQIFDPVVGLVLSPIPMLGQLIDIAALQKIQKKVDKQYNKIVQVENKIKTQLSQLQPFITRINEMLEHEQQSKL